MTFHATQALYGLPEHSSSPRLQPTVNGVFSDPYRLFNLDVFEFATHKNTALFVLCSGFIVDTEAFHGLWATERPTLWVCCG